MAGEIIYLDHKRTAQIVEDSDILPHYLTIELLEKLVEASYAIQVLEPVNDNRFMNR